ncbi:LTA synthase family protein [Paenibacillus daejeonensis]|uniref:LTA synthase family protein n=1 Tax=Paenibacillus daejeonensis TaxID=135193 RepID=UPI000372770B|nr:LTA synthase family protein [Paenibacillus daejeonensis]
MVWFAARNASVLGRLRGAELPFFILLLLIKLALFDHAIHVRNMRMGPDDVIVAAGTLGLLSFWTLWLSQRARILALIILHLLLTCILYADLIYFRYFQDLISIPVLMQAGQIGALGESIGSLLQARDIWLFADWPLLITLGIWLLLGRQSSRGILVQTPQPLLHKALLRVSLSLIVFALSLALVFVPIQIAKRTWAQGLFVGIWWNVSLYNVTGLFGFHGYDAYQYVKQELSKSELPENQLAETSQWLKEHRLRTAASMDDALFGAYKEHNVIMVQAEAIQSFMIGRTYNGQTITPFLNELTQASAYFPDFYHQTAQGRTSDADFAAQCSMQPLPTGSVFIRYAQQDYSCLPGVLRDNGFSTSVYHAYDGGFWNRNVMYHTMGYDTYYNRNDFLVDEPLGWSVGDRSFFRQSVQKMTAQRQPFYSFLITLSSHHPYSLPASYKTLDLGALNGTMFGDYLQSVHYVDQAFRSFTDELKTAGLWENSIVVFYGDHDNSIRDWSPFETFLGHSLSELQRERIQRQVPLLIHLPDGSLAGTYPGGGQLDLAPTLLHLLGIRTEETFMLGAPLLTAQPLPERTVVFRNGAFATADRYFIPAGDGVVEHGTCYSLPDGKTIDATACGEAAVQARAQLTHSDRIITHNLFPRLRER